MRPVSLKGRFCAFGKLPARPDFVASGISPAARRGWDAWIQAGLAACQQVHGPGWREVFADAPTWNFVLPLQIFGPATLIGVMLPSRDTVGRAYPLFLGAEIPFPADTMALMAGLNRWFAAVEALALDALDPGFDPGELQRRALPRLDPPPLPRRGRGPLPVAPGEGLALELPMASAAAAQAQETCGDAAPRRVLCWTGGGRAMPPMLAVSAQLVSPRGFVALIDGGWRQHGWQLAPLAAGRGGAPGLRPWDRDG
ncbi:type VI secretion system-associated protein TagF [Poseidonocella sp. HB161398]|uniref:type VI secretion system-associated protein TagF n=1 Tax=Poseidonocella sp. HB161398 TaxID=2320855 RepID=UPI001108E3CD|nr:type VI secretion system-associated protein TagF [Poseidonocella sp. HB161398]